MGAHCTLEPEASLEKHNPILQSHTIAYDPATSLIQTLVQSHTAPYNPIGSTQTSLGSTQTSSGSTQAMVVTHTPTPVPLDVGGSALSEGMNGDPHLPTSGYFVEGSMGLAGMRLFEWTADADLRFRRGIACSAAVAVQDVAVTSVTEAAPASSQRRTGCQLQVGHRIAVASSAVAETVGPSIAATVSDHPYHPKKPHRVPYQPQEKAHTDTSTIAYDSMQSYA